MICNIPQERKMRKKGEILAGGHSSVPSTQFIIKKNIFLLKRDSQGTDECPLYNKARKKEWIGGHISFLKFLNG
jgi:hypothetical protein